MGDNDIHEDDIDLHEMRRIEALRLANSGACPEDVIYRAKLYYEFLCSGGAE